ncbi:MAG: DsbA family protein [Rhodospirillales bacterium]|nr:DsbA family protein [Rhodospirillales bacterium]
MKRSAATLAILVALAAGLGYQLAATSPLAPPADAAGSDGAGSGAPGGAAGPNVAGLLDDAASPVVGNPAGRVSMVEFFDYRCPYCRAMQPAITALLAQDKSVRLVLKEWPIFGGVSIYAAKVALAANWQGKFLAVHDAIFALPRPMDQASVRAAAAKAGVDMARLDRDLKQRDGELDAALARNQREARALGFQGTPGLVIGRVVVPGALSEADLRHLVAEQKALPAPR